MYFTSIYLDKLLNLSFYVKFKSDNLLSLISTHLKLNNALILIFLYFNNLLKLYLYSYMINIMRTNVNI